MRPRVFPAEDDVWCPVYLVVDFTASMRPRVFPAEDPDGPSPSSSPDGPPLQ